MRLFIFNQCRRRYSRYSDSIQQLPPAEPKVVSDITVFHAETSSDVWFVKLICNIFYRYLTKSIQSSHFDYLRRNLSSSIAFEVIHRLNDCYRSPRLAFKFLEFTKRELNLVHSLMTYHLLMKSLCELSLLDSVQVVFKYIRLDGYSTNNWTLGLLVSSFVNTGKLDIAKDLLIKSQSGDTVIRPVVYNKLLNALMKKRHVDEAVQFFVDHILNSEYYCLDSCSFNIVIQGLCTIGEVEKAFQFFNDMGKYNCWPDDRTYNILINGFCRMNNVYRAHSLLRQMQSGNGVSPDSVSYTSLISGYCRLGQMDVSLSIFEEMINSGNKPTLITFNILINGFSKKGEMSSSMRIYEKMLFLGCFPDVVTFTSLIDGYCQSGDIDRGMKLFDEMKGRRLYPNEYTFSIIINALCRENRLTEARNVLRELNLRKDIVPQAFIYNPVIDGYCKAGNVDEANEIVSEMEENRCRADKLTYTILIIGHCVKGRMMEAIDIFNQMLAIGCNPDQITVNCLISLLLKAGKPNEAFHIMQTTSGVVSMKTNINIPVAV